MSLDWNISKCRDFEALSTDEQWPMTQTMIFGTMITGIGEITEATAPEFFARLKVAEALNGPFLVNGDGSPREITAADVARYLGLSTNVFPKESLTKWVKRIVTDGALREYARTYTTTTKEG